MRTRASILLVVCAVAPIAAGCDDDVSGVDREPPPIPAGVTSVTGDESVEIRWSPLVGADVAGYSIYASADPNRFVDADRIADVFGEDADHFVHDGIENGVTLYYAVSAFDFSGNESALSSEIVFDTPRPAGSGLVLFAAADRPSRSAVDWSALAAAAGGVVSHDSPEADYVLEARGSLLFLRGTTVVADESEYRNDVQDFGYTETLDEISWAPSIGWSENPEGVELIVGHAYVVWTWNDYYAKFRVVSRTATSVTLEWAYQATDDEEHRFELAPERRPAPKPIAGRPVALARNFSGTSSQIGCGSVSKDEPARSRGRSKHLARFLRLQVCKGCLRDNSIALLQSWSGLARARQGSEGWGC
jgi:hypothetical protein